MKSRVLFAAALMSCAALAAQGQVGPVYEKVLQEMSISPLGGFWIENALGPINITGSDMERVVVTAVKTVAGNDRDSIEDARANCVVSFEGTDKVRFVRTLVRPVKDARCSVSYNVQLPRSTDVKIAGKLGDVVVRNVNGGVTLNTFRSNVHFAGVTGASAIQLVSGRVIFELASAPVSNAQITMIAGDVDVYVPGDANFEWVANTLTGDIQTTIPVRGSISEGVFHGHVNSPGGPTINTQSNFGRVRLLARGTTPQQARTVRIPAGEEVRPPKMSIGTAPTTQVQTPIVGGAFIFPFPDQFVDVSIGEIRGPARVDTGAGKIELQAVFGDCIAITKGGPLNLGEIMGSLQARTGGGDILVRAAKLGGDIRTAGGNINVFYTGGPTLLHTAGGDIVVRQAAGPIDAQTPSGDITITVDPSMKTQRVEARTEKGNITLNVTSRFAADVDAMIVTTDANANNIHSDFASLTIRREQLAGGKTRIRATGKINGGGDRVELYADNGDITINSQAQAPVSIVRPNQ
jgi:DUF4097 and DUF4098 domain-containing protein YvlB